MLRPSLWSLAFVCLLSSTGCSLVVSNTLDGKKKDNADAGSDGGDGGDEGGAVEDCKNADGKPVADETPCGENSYCVQGVCVPSLCGDSRVVESLGEECDEGDGKDADDADGCTMLCKFTCDENADCETGTECDGTGTCENHVCVTSDPLPDGDPCTPTAGGTGECMNEVCVPLDCGDGETTGDEECDASDVGSGATAQNCKTDCTWTCDTDAECATGDLCNPATCNTTSHLCELADPVGCSPSDTCIASACDPATGACVESLIDDTDGDGYSGIACDDPDLDEVGGAGGDCDDDEDRNPKQADRCGDGIDNDCDGTIDPGTPTWYLDFDGDGYGSATAATVADCDQPDGYVGNNLDCQDNEKTFENANDAYPGQDKLFREPLGGDCAATGSSAACWDYNCDKKVTRRYEPLDCSAFGACKVSLYGTSPGVPKGYACGAYMSVFQCQFTLGPLGSCNAVDVGRDYQTCN